MALLRCQIGKKQAFGRGKRPSGRFIKNQTARWMRRNETTKGTKGWV